MTDGQNERMAVRSIHSFCHSLLHSLSCSSRFDRRLDADVGATAADVTRHSPFDFFVAGIRAVFQQGGGVHNLASLAVAALGDVVFDPGFLHGVVAVFGETFDGGDGLFADLRNGQHARAHGYAVEVDRAGAALVDAAAVLGTDEVDVVPQHPEQGRIGIDVHLLFFTVDVEIEGCHNILG